MKINILSAVLPKDHSLVVVLMDTWKKAMEWNVKVTNLAFKINYENSLAHIGLKPQTTKKQNVRQLLNNLRNYRESQFP